ncbi:hypothetical protein [Burkholderia pseudomallei]|uniref:Uncharacterized protein n=2 Tax=Burkholderia pseudomallei TaxID=28450 RepID=A3P4Z0_BURP0|nr:hypothetical protein [Burkholderia pseudomallei]ABN87355.1 hypothetical protein BURPS668_A1450 [Burkholderia pseudomallei 668]ABN95611.1 hypothetical protein BURPS1106A_A1365 [Burkholderia pseudomallei 1106a]AFR19303.1 hypothetical protein BPC006_II1375 [Burkholderia pseudomallei BPC006]AUL60388.1 hypothetical protein BHT10_32800 [Burkholderia pseudomallei]EEP49523.1 conserved hypothetical protein [Burkholderia pseudomallei MSHR346]
MRIVGDVPAIRKQDVKELANRNSVRLPPRAAFVRDRGVCRAACVLADDLIGAAKKCSGKAARDWLRRLERSKPSAYAARLFGRLA